MKEIKAKSARGLCICYGCKNRKHKGHAKCSKHVKRAERARDPIYARFKIVKDRAKRKGLAFTITIAEFRELAQKAGFLTVAGVHLDREDATEGYHLWNVQFLLAGENIAKGNRERYCPRYQEYLARKRAEEAAIAAEWVDESQFYTEAQQEGAAA